MLDDLHYRGADGRGRNCEPDELDDPNYRGAADDLDRNCELDDPNYRGAADDLDRNCELDEPNYRGADGLNYRDADDLDDLNYLDVADDLGQNCGPDGRDDRVALGDLDGHQHQLGVADDFLLRMDALVDLCARHYFCEVRDRILVYRRVAWHIDAIAKNTNKD